jgi:exonuclease SbcC
MSKYIINSLHIENFKTFDDFYLDFGTSELITFGGPNGYGKTTIFDALEIGLTGNVDRFIKVDKSGGSTDNLVAKDPASRVRITIVMSNVEHHLSFRRTLTPENRKSTNKIANFSTLWDLEQLVDGTWTRFTQKDLETFIDEKNLGRYYNNFFYIQQEDTAHFLKKDEQARLDLIAQLFDIKKENDELSKLQALKTKVDAINKKTLEEQQSLSQGMLQVGQMVESVEYQRLFHFAHDLQEQEFQWDKEYLAFPEIDTKDKYINELHRIKSFLDLKNETVKYYQVGFFKQNIERIKALIALHYFASDLVEIIKIGNDKKIIQKIVIDLENINFLLENRIDLTILKDKMDFDFLGFMEAVADAKRYRDNLSKSDKVIRELVGLRNDLVIKFQESVLEKQYCPVCGHDWEEADKLIAALNEKKVFLNALLESETKSYNSKLDDLKLKIKTFQLLINNLLRSDPISNEYLDFILKNQVEVKVLERYFEFLQENKIDISDLLLNDLSVEITDALLSERAVVVIERIDKTIVFSESFLHQQDTLGLLDVYRRYFGGKEENIQNITPEGIQQKERYIETMYFRFNQSKHDRLTKIFIELRKTHELSTNIAALITIYNTKISAHRKKMIKDIEIPFYIYSGKILHNVRGTQTSGVFIKDTTRGDDNKLNNIRFVANNNSEQDIINTTSSGQLAGIVIALTLTLNRIYSKNLNSIFIDDPVQSMDDINMISLIELLRNDFKDKQFFVSTHEDEIEKYILYKYMKHAKSVCRVDVMNQQLFYKE